MKPVCGKCGSDDVYGSATLVWDMEKQTWVLSQPETDTATIQIAGYFIVTKINCMGCLEVTNLHMDKLSI